MPLKLGASRGVRGLLALTTLTLVVAMPKLHAVTEGEPADDRLAPMRQLFRNPDSATVLGRAYLRAFPEEGDAEFLAAELFGPEIDRALPRLRAILRQRIERDFATADTVVVQRWILARSECRAFALVALLQARAAGRGDRGTVDAGRGGRTRDRDG